MKAAVFLGPTLRVHEARALCEAVYLPPARMGDVYRIAREKPRVIAIIDGYFEHHPSIWHKEILWAMSEGVHVLGASSMGALRAAELSSFGMEGAGEIFEAYARGELEDDDEVAVAHAGPEDDFRAASDAMVNVRATLARAEEEGILDGGARRLLADIAKGLYYPDRSYARIALEARHRGLDEAVLARWRQWLPGGRVDQKADDARKLLASLRARFADEGSFPKKRVSYIFEHTHGWEALRRHVEAEPAISQAPASNQAGTRDALVLDELRLAGDFQAAKRAALARVLAAREAARAGRGVSAQSTAETIEALRRERGLLEGARFAEWLAAEHLSPAAFEELAEGEAHTRWVEQTLGAQAERAIPDHLRLAGAYQALLARALDKESRLLARGYSADLDGLPGASTDELWAWYFGGRGESIPVDLDAFAAGLGFSDLQAFRRAVLRAYAARVAGGRPDVTP